MYVLMYRCICVGFYTSIMVCICSCVICMGQATHSKKSCIVWLPWAVRLKIFSRSCEAPLGEWWPL